MHDLHDGTEATECPVCYDLMSGCAGCLAKHVLIKPCAKCPTCKQLTCIDCLVKMAWMCERCPNWHIKCGMCNLESTILGEVYRRWKARMKRRNKSAASNYVK